MVALDDDTVNVLKRHREHEDADREEWGSARVGTGMVFTQEDGSWLHPGKVTDLFERLVAASGLPPIRLHDLRHGAATLMLAAGIDVKKTEAEEARKAAKKAAAKAKAEARAKKKGKRRKPKK